MGKSLHERRRGMFLGPKFGLSGGSDLASEFALSGATALNSGVGVPVTPLTIAQGATFWTDPSLLSSVTLNGGDVAQLNDLSGGAHDAAQATAANQPLYAAGGSGINSKSVVNYTGANNDNLALANALTLGRNVPGMSFVGVARLASLGTLARLLTILTGSGVTLFAAQISATGALNGTIRRLGADTTFGPASTVTMSANVASFFALTVDFASGATAAVLDGTSRAQTASWATGAASEDVNHAAAPTLGRNGANLLTGDLAECCFWPRALTTTELANLRTNYFKPKWGTP